LYSKDGGSFYKQKLKTLFSNNEIRKLNRLFKNLKKQLTAKTSNITQNARKKASKDKKHFNRNKYFNLRRKINEILIKKNLRLHTLNNTSDPDYLANQYSVKSTLLEGLVPNEETNV
tara:strand:- start:2199 stop:2549 length:351 start_codon:yes stop_codon:yes gene_type:complete